MTGPDRPELAGSPAARPVSRPIGAAAGVDPAEPTGFDHTEVNPAEFDPGGTLPAAGETLVIEASAGTGKTWAIAHLATRFLAETGVDLRQIAMITFSNAAAGELKTRVRRRLIDASAILAAPTPPDAERWPEFGSAWQAGEPTRRQAIDRWQAALAVYDQAPILTTHSFCATLLAHLGLLADHDPSDRLVADIADLIDQTAEDAYVRLSAGQPPGFSAVMNQAWAHQALFAPTARLSGAEPAIVDHVAGMRAEVERRKRRQGVYTFDDLLQRCAAAVTDPHSGPAACDRLAQLYPVVLVDEFQDTDQVQWDIIKTAFVGRSRVVLIGDPKQSIYRFRGADLGSYFDASRQSRLVTASTNRRTAAPIVRAISALMGGTRLGPGVVVRPSVTSPNTPRLVKPDGQVWSGSLRLRLPADRQPRPVADARQLIVTDLAADISRLLTGGPRLDRPPDGQRPLTPPDIAILVGQNKQADLCYAALTAAGLPAVIIGRNSVFASDAAQDWLRLLQALESGRLDLMKAASLTALIGWDLTRLAEASGQDLAGVIQLGRDLSTHLATGGPVGLLGWLSEQTDLVERLTATPAGERRLTDLRHVAQLLQQLASAPTSVWLAQQIAALQPDPDQPGVTARRSADPTDAAATSRRLPTDDQAVTIRTIHAAKGLEFPVVYLPFLADLFPRKIGNGQAEVFPGDDGRVISLGWPTHSQAVRQQLGADEADESLRLAYVGLTRASAMVTSWWVPTPKNTTASALHRLLFRDGSVVPAAVPLTQADPSRLASRGVSLETIDAAGAAPAYHPDRAATWPRPLRHWSRPIDAAWRRTSFSALTADAHADPTNLDEADEPADQLDVESAIDDPRLDQLSPMADLPGGPAFGSLVHAIFEYADPAAPDLTAEVARRLPAGAMPGLTATELAQALLPGLHTPLGDIAHGRALADIPLADRLAELTFELPLAQAWPGAQLQDIADLIERHLLPDDPLRGYAGRLRHLPGAAGVLRGFLTGSIDLVTRVDDRFIVIDYKTNRLGPPGQPLRLRAYTRPGLAEAMIASHYPLQALLYEVALHRFLRWRLPGYDPATHLGGAAYLFVRGMAGPSTPVVAGSPCGVFAWAVPPSLVVELSDSFRGRPT